MRGIVITACLMLMTPLMAQDDGFAYVGANSCKVCHKKSAQGNQYGKWEETPHAKALETLKSDAALAVAKERGVSTPPSETGECLVCHTTGWGKEGGYELLAEEFVDDPANARAVKKNVSKANVGCEMCHGAGSGYKAKKKMEAIFAGRTKAASLGLVMPTEEVCRTCHNEKSPNFTGFNFDEMFAKISHPYPDEMRAQRGY